jgi:endonuclease-3 related protein
LRDELLSIPGIGPETADSILLYALNRPVFVIDAYTRRIFLRHKLIDENWDYEQIKKFFEDNLPRDTQLYNEYHALLVKLGKQYCKKNEPLCNTCPLYDIFI